FSRQYWHQTYFQYAPFAASWNPAGYSLSFEVMYANPPGIPSYNFRVTLRDSHGTELPIPYQDWSGEEQGLGGSYNATYYLLDENFEPVWLPEPYYDVTFDLVTSPESQVIVSVDKRFWVENRIPTNANETVMGYMNVYGNPANNLDASALH